MPRPEQENKIKPLHGDWVYGLRIVPLDGKYPTLIRRRYAMEWSHTERVSAEMHPSYPGIHVAELFETPFWYSGEEPISLEEARDQSKYSQRFLMSMAASGLAVMSSRIGYRETRNVRVLPPSDYVLQHGRDLDLEVRMRDYDGRTSDKDLTKRHIGRVARAGGDVSVELLPQEEMDEVFRHIVQDRTGEFNSFDSTASSIGV
jgi:hypothetical protein